MCLDLYDVGWWLGGMRRHSSKILNKMKKFLHVCVCFSMCFYVNVCFISILCLFESGMMLVGGWVG